MSNALRQVCSQLGRHLLLLTQTRLNFLAELNWRQVRLTQVAHAVNQHLLAAHFSSLH